MALIEIPNIYNSEVAVSAAGRSRLAVIGEPIVAVDLINTRGGTRIARGGRSPVGGSRCRDLVAAPCHGQSFTISEA